MGLGGGGVTWGNFGTGVGVSFLKPTPIIYLVFEKMAYEQNVYIFIYCSLIFYTLFAICKQSSQLYTNITILVSELNI